MKRARVLLADDHRMFAEGLESLLGQHFELVGIVADGRALIARARELEPDVLVVDVNMPLLNGIDAVMQLKKGGLSAKIVFLTAHQEMAYAARAFELGASGYVLKHSAASELIAAIHAALEGNKYISPLIARELMHTWCDQTAPPRNLPGELTARQREVLQLFAEGRSAKEVAAVLNISARTAEFHKSNIMKLLGIHTVAELTLYAVRERIVSV